MHHIVHRRMAAIYKWLAVNSNNMIYAIDLCNGDRYKERCTISFLLTVNGDIFLSTPVY